MSSPRQYYRRLLAVNATNWLSVTRLSVVVAVAVVHTQKLDCLFSQRRLSPYYSSPPWQTIERDVSWRVRANVVEREREIEASRSNSPLSERRKSQIHVHASPPFERAPTYGSLWLSSVTRTLLRARCCNCDVTRIDMCNFISPIYACTALMTARSRRQTIGNRYNDVISGYSTLRFN